MITMTDLGDRHVRSDPSGSLVDATESNSGTVFVAVEPRLASTRAGQHALFMALNLLVRQDRLVTRVVVNAPDELLHDRIWPFAGVKPTSIFAMVKACGLQIVGPRIPVEMSSGDHADAAVVVTIGNAPVPVRDVHTICIFGDGWKAYAGPSGSAPTHVPASDNPLGPYFAACLATGEVFKFFRRVRPGRGAFIERLAVSLFDLSVCESWEMLPADKSVGGLRLQNPYLVGAGAVGQAAALTVGAFANLSGHLTVIDPESLDDLTNLNRYALADLEDLVANRPKADVVETYLTSRGLSVHSASLEWQEFMKRIDRSGQRPELVQLEGRGRYRLILSCVDDTDGNIARHAIQNVWPETLIGASTHGDGLRASVSVYNMQADQMCLKCRNPLRDPRKALAAFVENLRTLSEDERRSKVSAIGLSADEVEKALSEPTCSSVGLKQLADYVERAGPPNFSVGFTSVAAGIMLAAHLIRYSLDGIDVLRHTAGGSAFFYFLRPGLRRIYQGRNPSCDCVTHGRVIYRSQWQSDSSIPKSRGFEPGF